MAEGIDPNRSPTALFCALETALANEPALARELEGKVPAVYVVGDCSEPAKLLEAVGSGFLTGQKI